MSNEITKEEVRSQFLDLIWANIRYWNNVKNDDGTEMADKDKLEGLAFSMMNIFDGTSIGFPAVDLVIRPHPEDKQYNIDNDEDYYKDGMIINDDVHLHNMILKEDE